MHRLAVTFLALAAAGCAPTTGPVSPPLEVAVILDREARTLTLIPVDSVALTATVPLPMAPTVAPAALAVRGGIAAVGYGDDSVMIVDLVQREVLRRFSLGAVGPLVALAFGNDGRGYAASPRAGRVTAFSPATGELVATIIDGGPQGFAQARGTIFTIIGNRQFCYPPAVSTQCSTGASWLVPLEGVAPFDSIAMPGPGNATTAVTASDGLIYVLNSGDGDGPGRLSVIDPVDRVEIASFGGLGEAPQHIATDGANRLYIASASEGLMVFDIRGRRFIRGAGAGVPLDRPLGLLVDALGNIYVLEAGSCAGGTAARVRVFGPDLVPRRDLETSGCPVAMALTEIPAELLGIDR